jgi:lipid A ethanolaminephosphotransferase
MFAQLTRAMKLRPSPGRHDHPPPLHAAVGETGLAPETLLLCVSLFWAVLSNRTFFGQALAGRSIGDPSAWGFGLALGIVLVALNFLLLALLSSRHTLKPVVALLAVLTAFSSHFIQQFGVYLHPSMLRNALRTDVKEAQELFAWGLIPHLLLHAGLPLLLLWKVPLQQRPFWRALRVRLAWMVAALLVAVGALLAIFQPFSSLMRNHKEMRYLITPSNVLWSLGAVVAQDTRGAVGPRQAIGLDAQPGPGWAIQTRPKVLILVVGETARAANWGLNGYSRQTTPELAQLPVIRFAETISCGTNTEVSLPCMFAPVGRRDYNEERIRRSDSLLHVLARAGVAVHWRDNQSGCKGVCDGLPNDSVESLKLPQLCDGGRCLDEGLLHGLEERLLQARGTQLLVLHQLGNHGPSYFRRYPEAFRKFLPACEQDDLRQCSREEIVNAYDNALLYTDHVLARAIRTLQAHAAEVDSALLYVSDHGESLGEGNLFLHGIPYAIAPDVQTRVPMLMWISEGFARTRSLDTACLKRRAEQPARHDHLFHTLLTLTDVMTRLYEPDWDLTRGCLPAAAALRPAVSAPPSPGS